MIRFVVNLVLGAMLTLAVNQQPEVEMVHVQEGATQVVDGFYLEDGDKLTVYTDGSYTIVDTEGNVSTNEDVE